MTDAVVTEVDGPRKTLPAEPVIETDEQVNMALHELAFMEYHSASAQHECDEKIRQLREDLSDKLVVEFDGEPVSFATRAEQLKGALRQFVEAKRPQLKTANGAKSEEFQHGTLGWVKSRDAIVYAKGITHAKAIEAIDASTSSIKVNEGGLKKRLAELASSLRLFARDKQDRAIELFIDLHAKISLARVMDALRTKKVTSAQLKKWGMVLKKGGDEFVVKPHKYEVPRR